MISIISINARGVITIPITYRRKLGFKTKAIIREENGQLFISPSSSKETKEVTGLFSFDKRLQKLQIEN